MEADPRRKSIDPISMLGGMTDKGEASRGVSRIVTPNKAVDLALASVQLVSKFN